MPMLKELMAAFAGNVQITSLFGMNGILKLFFEIILTITTTIELI